METVLRSLQLHTQSPCMKIEGEWSGTDQIRSQTPPAIYQGKEFTEWSDVSKQKVKVNVLFFEEVNTYAIAICIINCVVNILYTFLQTTEEPLVGALS